ncbi:hypothetical protein TNCV_3057571 [Trichonephila clavipes]|nr:hypothetical protein TNCV_3057571 [Trichonephila clavipes]
MQEKCPLLKSIRHKKKRRATANLDYRLIVRSAVTAPDSSLSTIGRATRTRVSTMTFHKRPIDDESRLQLCPDDHRRRVWRRTGLRDDPVFTSARHTVPQPGVMV